MPTRHASARKTYPDRSADAHALPPLVRALLRPEAYPHPAGDFRVFETHISWVILAGGYAYKIKKHVNFGFLDFSSLEQRATDCAEEVRLNRRLSPDVYLGVVEVVERDGTYHIGGDGHVVEPAVRMRRLPDAGMLPHLLAEGAVDARLIRRIARRLARFHAGAATGPGVDEWGSLETVRANWTENFTQMAPFIGRALPAAHQETIAAYVDRFLTEYADLFRAREAHGCIRDGHGDLHAASICVEGRRIHLFDCLEFTARFRCADVAAEVAFLAMDLDHYGRADLAAAFVDAYVQASGDTELRHLLNFYACYRAYVRGKVLSFRLAEPALSSEEETAIIEQTRGYFDLAWSYAGGLVHPVIVMTMGLPASGKTSLADALASHLGLVHLSSDVARKELTETPLTQRPATEEFRQGLYRPAVTRRTYAALRRRAARWLRRGRSVALDATYGNPAERAAVVRLAARHGVRLVVLVCEADEATIRARLAARAHDPRVVSDARLDLWPALRAAFSDPAELPDALRLDMTQPMPAIVDRVINALA